MISNFQIKQGASVPWLEVEITRDGRVSMYTQAVKNTCQDASDPNVVDLSDAQSIQFEMFKCGRVPAGVGLSGEAEFVDKAKGLVRYKWHPNDTSAPGIYYVGFKITFNNGYILRWPYQLESLAVEVSL